MNAIKRAAKAALGILVLIAIVGCLNPFESGSDRRDREGRFESGRLMGRMAINSGEGLTPSTIGLGHDFDLRSQITRYAVVLTGLGGLEGEAVTVDPYTEGASIDLAYGSWQLDMTAYRDENLVAIGQVRPSGGHGPGNVITVGLDTATAEVKLQPLTNASGTLDLTVSWSGTVEVEQFTLSPIADVDSWELGDAETIGSDEYTLADESLTLSRTMDSGYYELSLQVNQGSLQGHLVEVVQVYDHLVSTGTYDLTEFFPVNATVTFDPQGGDPPDLESKLVAPGSVYGALPTPSREGYTFVGWSPDTSGEPIVTASSTVEESGDHTLFAQWEINEYTITFDTDGGSDVDPITQNFGTAIAAPDDPTRMGYTFTGWDPAVPETMPAESVTISAQWQINQYTVTFDSAGGADVDPITQDFETTITPPTSPTREGHLFAGWNPALPEVMPAEDMTLVAHWTVGSYLISFEANGGDGTMTGQGVEFEETVTLELNGYTREGYSFTGWALEDGGEVVYEDQADYEHTIPENVTLHARWTPITYTVTLNPQEGEGGTTSVVATFDAAMPGDVTAPTRSGYSFDGYWSVPGTGGVQYYTAEMGSARDWDIAATTTLYARWTANTYQVTFVPEGGTPPEPESMQVVFDAEYGSLAITSRAGYTLIGWFTESTGGTEVVETTLVTTADDHELFAQWEVNQYTVTFMDHDSTVITTQEVQHGSDATAPADPTREGHAFDGWNPGFTNITGDLTVTAQYTVNSYTITFDSDGGAEVTPITEAFGAELDPPENPEKTGHTFYRWVPPLPETMPAENLELTAEWWVNEYQITFDPNGGPFIPAELQYYGYEVIPILPTPTWMGYTFTGWDPEPPSAMPADDLHLTAQWEINQYTITFDSAGGTAVEPVTQDFDTTIIPPANPTRDGYTFAGWNPRLPTTMPADELTLVAQWVANLATLDFREMVTVQGGQFIQQDTNNNSFEHTISLFEIAKYPVTYELWYTVRVWGENNGYVFANPGLEGSWGTIGAEPTTAPTRHEPVTRVSWRDAIVWLNAYSEMDGLSPVYLTEENQPIRESSVVTARQENQGQIDNPNVDWNAEGYRLPTEGEWQYAASWRGNDNTATGVTEFPVGSGLFWTPFNWASGATADIADAAATGAVAWYMENIDQTQPVGQKNVNQLGLFDMSGNVWEWIWDWWDVYPSGQALDFRGPGTGHDRVIRGGSWKTTSSDLPVGSRFFYDFPWTTSNDYGFRPARSVENGASEAYNIGDTGPAGGIVFYVDTEDEYSDWTYLEAWTTDEGSFEWKTSNTDTPGTLEAIGSGYANTYTAMTGSEHPAAQAAIGATHGGLNDWFLPSKDELNLMFQVRDVIGGFASTYYWSSSENNSGSAWAQNFGSGAPNTFDKSYYLERVRAIRAFKP